MAGVVTVGEVSANPGEMKFGNAISIELRDGTPVGLPVIVINGKEAGPKVVITAATHPPELLGVAAVQVVARKVNPQKLKGSLIMFPITNPLGMQFGEYVSPHDGVNMSSAYPGSKTGSPTYRLANFVWTEAAQGASLVMDFHENAKPCLCFSITDKGSSPDVERKASELADAFGITVIGSGEAEFTLPGVKATDKSFTGLCMQNGIPAFTPEFEGGPEVWTFREQGNVVVPVRGVMNVLGKLGMVEGNVEPQSGVRVLKGNFVAWGIAHSNRAGFVDRMVDPGVKISKGTQIARILNAYGEEVESINMPTDGYLWGWTTAGGSNKRHLTVPSGGNVAYIFAEK
jgi:predicted deacylase